MRETRSYLTATTIEQSLRRIGVREGGVLVVHSSMSALGYVLHGVDTLLGALRTALGPSGTLLAPAFTGEFTDPSCWQDPTLPPSVWNDVRESMPLFDKARTLPRLMGQLPVAMLVDPQAERSDHPLCSWVAIGPQAAELCAKHDLHDPFGPRSPLGRVREAGGQVLLLGVDQRKNAALMHAHVMTDNPQVRRNKGTFLAEVHGARQWVTPARFVECSEGYANLENDLVSSGLVRVARIGDSDCRLMDVAAITEAVTHTVKTQPDRIFCGRGGCRQCVAA